MGKKPIRRPKRLITIHSQKGGVGKTLIGIYLARRLAQREPDRKPERTVFIDADLTGTSVAEALPLRAPKDTRDHYGLYETRELLKKYSFSKEFPTLLPRPHSRDLKFLNDLLLTPPETYRDTLEDKPGKDTKKRSSNNFGREMLLWQVDPGILADYLSSASKLTRDELELGQLRVIPSSGYARHITQSVPHIYKEGVTEYLERRLAEIVCSLWADPWDGGAPFDSVIVDTSPMLRGISRVALNLHRRVKNQDSFTVTKLPSNIVTKAIFVCTLDPQDVMDMARALDELLPPTRAAKNTFAIDDETVLLVFNKVPRDARVPGPPDASGYGHGKFFNFRDDPPVLEYVDAYLRSLHEPRSALFKISTRSGSTLKSGSRKTGFMSPDKSFVCGFESELQQAFMSVIQSSKLLYGSVSDLEALFKEVSQI